MINFKKFKGSSVWILVDPILIKDELRNELSKCKKINVVNLFKNTINSHIDFYSSPLLISIDSRGEVFLNRVVDLCAEASSPLIIFSTNVSEVRVIGNFKKMMFPIVDDKMNFFRFYEYHFFIKLKEIFSNEIIFDDFLDIYCLSDDYSSYSETLKIKKVK